MLLVLYPDTFIWEQDNKTLMYNCSSKQTYPFEAIHPIDKYCLVLTDMQNLYVVEIREEDMENPVLKEWVRQIMGKKMGFIKEQEEGESHIISFPPILNLQSDVDRIEKQEGRDIGEYAAQNWNECTLFMGGERNTRNCTNNCTILWTITGIWIFMPCKGSFGGQTIHICIPSI